MSEIVDQVDAIMQTEESLTHVTHPSNAYGLSRVSENEQETQRADSDTDSPQSRKLTP